MCSCIRKRENYSRRWISFLHFCIWLDAVTSVRYRNMFNYWSNFSMYNWKYHLSLILYSLTYVFRWLSCSVLLFGFSVFLGVYISTILQLLIITILFTCCTLAVLFIAPVEDKNKPLSEPEVKKCKAKVKVILSLYSIIFAVLCCFSQTQRYAVFIMLAVATVSILVGISKIVDLAKKRTAI